MAEKGVYKYYEGLPPYGKLAVIIGIIIIIIIILLAIRKALKDSKEKKSQMERDQEYIEDFKKYCLGKANAGQSSYPATSYIQMANNIYEAGCYEDIVTCYGTDNDAIKGVFEKMNSECDVIQLVQAFGKRYQRSLDSRAILNPGYWFGLSNPYEKLELGAWLKSELDGKEIEEYVNGVLSAKGINYRF